PRRPAVRPVQTHAVAQRSAEQLVHRHAEGLGLEVPQRQLDPRDGLVGDAAEVLSGRAQHVPVQALDGAGVLTDDQMREVGHAAADPVGALVAAAPPPPRDPRVGLALDEGPRPPAAVAVQRLHTGDLHRRVLPSSRSSYPCTTTLRLTSPWSIRSKAW